ncbi:hypothetical protein DYU05_14410 [Mucilaginibacter terrenus]|uniref:Sigma-70 family RNA polymerase sigma factor n=1 Tax=Mucilaginibacter terrenus TaxID=2482727 RepID=A0A3E2NQQ2_9SPHI|nr:hypothetical protein [Mucilaginibacter terrenus]RFZ83324.1 hypothetical protein DYU05_14410 [Mucilaginibacter terrenus]
MKPQLKSTSASPLTAVPTKQGLYNSYADMLLGYIYEVVKSKSVAEQYLVEIFNELNFADIAAITKPGVNTYCRLQQLARNKVAAFTSSKADDTSKSTVVMRNRFTDLMTAEQQQVFCGVHYHGKTISKLSLELKKPEDEIKRILKQSFILIRNQRNDTATVHR